MKTRYFQRDASSWCTYCKFILAICWCAGLACGIFISFFSEEQVPYAGLILPGILKPLPAILFPMMPFLILGVLQYKGKVRSIFLLTFCKALLFSFLASRLYSALTPGDPQMVHLFSLLIFNASAFYGVADSGFRKDAGFSILRFFLLLSINFLIYTIDFSVITPLLGVLIFKKG